MFERKRPRTFEKPNMPTSPAPTHLDRRTPVLKIDCVVGPNTGQLECMDDGTLISMDDNTLIQLA